MLVVPLEICLASSMPDNPTVRQEELEHQFLEWASAEELPDTVFLLTTRSCGFMMARVHCDEINSHYQDVNMRYTLTIVHKD